VILRLQHVSKQTFNLLKRNKQINNDNNNKTNKNKKQNYLDSFTSQMKLFQETNKQTNIKNQRKIQNDTLKVTNYDQTAH